MLQPRLRFESVALLTAATAQELESRFRRQGTVRRVLEPNGEDDAVSRSLPSRPMV